MRCLVRFRSPSMFVYERVFKSKVVAKMFVEWLRDHDFEEPEVEETARKPGDNRFREEPITP